MLGSMAHAPLDWGCQSDTNGFVSLRDRQLALAPLANPTDLLEEASKEVLVLLYCNVVLAGYFSVIIIFFASSTSRQAL